MSTESHISQFDPEKAKALEAAATAWQARQKEKEEDTFEKAREALLATIAELPESVQIPYAKTPEGERMAKFRGTCDENFLAEIDFTRVRNPGALKLMMNWDGRFPGPCATGATGVGKTFAAWQTLRERYVKHNQPFAWFPVRRLVTELERYEKNDCADEFFRHYDFFKILFVDDLDKINWDFESHAQLLFSFLDWVYRKKKPCIVTTNRDRAWWKEKAGAALVRRLFDDAHFEVKF